MAYPYYPQYQPYYPQGYQPMAQAVQQQVTQQPPIGIIWVNSEMEVMSYPVAPNAAVTLWNAKEPVVYLKKADSTGKPSLTIYDLVERTESSQAKPDTPEFKTSDFALKSDLDAMAATISALKKEIKGLKRKEVEDDDE